ncbi:hypothetical protein DPV78_003923 [Talaromyces pinophilus]|jgi:hypothetical protein|nr:hypothetical protein DPV78_003923 [Talaromyces pinophilus]
MEFKIPLIRDDERSMIAARPVDSSLEQDINTLSEFPRYRNNLKQVVRLLRSFMLLAFKDMNASADGLRSLKDPACKPPKDVWNMVIRADG